MIISTNHFKKLVVKGSRPTAAKLRKDTLPSPVESVGDRTLRFVISTNAVDRDGDTIDQAGWDLTAYRANPIVLYGHDQSSLPIGRAIEIGVQDGKLCATVEFVPATIPVAGPIAEAVYQLCKGGFLSATSVGFSPQVYELSDDPDRSGNGAYPGLDHQQQALLEFSIVSVPSNYEALIIPDSIDQDIDPSFGDGATTNTNQVTASFDGIAQARLRARIIALDDLH